MGRYITSDDVKVHLELSELTSDTSPSLEAVENWISSAEDELDMRSHNRFDLHEVSNEIVDINGADNVFFTKHTPLVSITKLEYNNGDDFSPDWVEIDSTDYAILNSNIGMFSTKSYYYQERKLRISYQAGNTTIPQYVKELALLLVEKRYLMSRLGIAVGDTEVVSIASIQIRDKMKSNLEYRLNGLEKEIEDRFKMWANGLKVKFFKVGYNLKPQLKRYR